MATKKSTESQSALATTQDEAEQLASILDDMSFDVDGMEEVGTEDIKIPVKAWNVKLTSQDGEPVPPNRFYDTVKETLDKSLDCVFLTLHKERRWAYYEADKDEMVRVCSSPSSGPNAVGELHIARQGIGEAGTQRKCATCPQAQWRSIDGARVQECTQVYNVIALDLRDDTPFVIRFKKTGLPPFKAHLNKHHINARRVGGKLVHVPLFAYQVKLELAMADARYAVPVITRGTVLDRERMTMVAEAAAGAREYLADAMTAADNAEQTAKDDGQPRQEKINPNDFMD